MIHTIITILITTLVSIGYYNLFWHITEYTKKKRGHRK